MDDMKFQNGQSGDGTDTPGIEDMSDKELTEFLLKAQAEKVSRFQKGQKEAEREIQRIAKEWSLIVDIKKEARKRGRPSNK